MTEWERARTSSGVSNFESITSTQDTCTPYYCGFDHPLPPPWSDALNEQQRVVCCVRDADNRSSKSSVIVILR